MRANEVFLKAALKRGLLGAVIACAVALLVAIPYPPPWTLSEVLIPIGITAFAVAFFSVCRRSHQGAKPNSTNRYP